MYLSQKLEGEALRTVCATRVKIPIPELDFSLRLLRNRSSSLILCKFQIAFCNTHVLESHE